LKDIKLGFVEITANNNIFETYFNLTSSSSRNVSFLYQNDEIKCFVNNIKSGKKDHVKKVTIDSTR
jgi:hypothetical protein